MAINHLPAIDDYWKRDLIYDYSPITGGISQDRFREKRRYLHFVNNETLAARGDAGCDRLGKMRPRIDHLSAHSQTVYAPETNKTRHQSVGSRGQPQWLLLEI